MSYFFTRLLSTLVDCGRTIALSFHNHSMPSVTTDQWLEAAAYRRSVHGLAGTSKVSDKRVEEIVAKVLDFAPSSYNTQPVRISLAFGKKHEEMWSIILEKAEPILKGINPELWEKLGPLFQSHQAAYGSVRSPLATCIHAVHSVPNENL